MFDHLPIVPHGPSLISRFKAFFEEFKEMRRFQSLPEEERVIVFYAENNASYVYFETLIKELVENLDRQICYLTSSATDPMLSSNNDKIKVFYIGERFIRALLFFILKADVLILDMPDLETFHVKRSRVYPVHYIYVFHSIFSVHSYLRKGAVDHYDTVFCVGPHHIKEIRATERAYGLMPKRLVEYGYSRLDALIRERSQYGQKEPEFINGRKKILIAPSFGENSILEAMGCEVIDILLRAGYHVTARPHPVTQRKNPLAIQKIKSAFEGHPRFVLETEIRNHHSFHQSHCMISDWSGVSLEYAFALERPVIFIDVPQKVKNPDWGKISLEPIEIKIREEVGRVVPPDQLAHLPEAVESICKDTESYRKRIGDVREKTVFHVGKTGKIGADYVVRIVAERRKKNQEDC